MRELLYKLASLFRKQRDEQDVAAEIDSHLALAVDEYVQAGMSPAEARRQALTLFSGIEAESIL